MFLDDWSLFYDVMPSILFIECYLSLWTYVSDVTNVSLFDPFPVF